MASHKAIENAGEHAAELEHMSFAELEAYVGEHADDAEALYQLGYDYVQCLEQEPDNIEHAIAYLTKAADLGHSQAHIEMANLYWCGTGVSKDFAKAVDWLTKATLVGDRRGLEDVFDLFARHIFVEGSTISPEDTVAATQALVDGLLEILDKGIPPSTQKTLRPIDEGTIQSLQKLFGARIDK